MLRLPYRIRLFVALLLVSAVPVALVTGGGVVALGALSLMNQPGDIDSLAVTWGTAQQELARADLPPTAREALARHDATVARIATLGRPAADLARKSQAYAPYLLWLAGGVILLLVAIAGMVLSRQLSAPLDEVVAWTRLIQRHEPLPTHAHQRGIPEFDSLRGALRDLQSSLEQARAAELEAVRLRAFGEVARRVAHEMKNPLTPIRLAVVQLSRDATPEIRDSLEVIAAESARLEAMAREFAELGRLPEGVAAPVDLREILEELLRSAVPDSMERRLESASEIPPILGYYDPLRRAFSNILRNAVEACGGKGVIAVGLRHDTQGTCITVSDTGPGIPEEKREVIFQPYYTEKGDGTGLGLAIVRQTIEQHHGWIRVSETPGGGATFTIFFPA